MKKILAFLLFTLLIFTEVSCTVRTENNSGEVIIPEGYKRININTQPYTHKLEGIGAQMDQCMFSGGFLNLNGFDENITEEDVALWDERLDYMKIDVTRMCIIPDWYETKNDNSDPDVLDDKQFTWDNDKMKCLYRIMDVCKKHNIKINLSWYGVFASGWNAAHTEFASWIDAPKSDEEFAESVYAALRHLLDMGYGDVINEISFYPEPHPLYVQSGGYRKMLETVNAKLVKEGIRDRFLLTGPAEVSNYELFEGVFKEAGDLFDRYTGSFYKFNNKTPNYVIKDDMERFASLSASVGKAYGISECGSSEATTPPSAAEQVDTDLYRRATYMAKFLINALDSGFTYINYWVLSNAWYDGFMMNLGLWKYKDTGWALRPQYYTYSLITRYTDPGSFIYGSDFSSGAICLTALKNEDGKWTYILESNAGKNARLSLVNPAQTSGSLDLYEVTEQTLPKDVTDYRIEKSKTVTVTDGAINLELKPNSVVVLTDIVY